MNESAKAPSAPFLALAHSFRKSVESGQPNKVALSQPSLGKPVWPRTSTNPVAAQFAIHPLPGKNRPGPLPCCITGHQFGTTNPQLRRCGISLRTGATRGPPALTSAPSSGQPHGRARAMPADPRRRPRTSPQPILETLAVHTSKAFTL